MLNLTEWLCKLEKIHPNPIDLGLDRVHVVAKRLELLPWKIPTVSIAGTNGKGSCTALTSIILLEAGYKTGSYFSPHLLRFNERIQLNNHEVSDELICAAFTEIEKARKEISLTYFEFATLAALWIFKHQQVDFAILEVGLGGRLDAVNLIDADIAVITSIDLDHQEWLGNTREQIAVEKAGICRSHKPTVCGETNPPETLIHYAAQLQIPLFLLGQDFVYEEDHQEWKWHSIGETDLKIENLPIPSIYLGNAATTLQVIHLLKENYLIENQAIFRGLEKIKLAGRYEWIKQGSWHIFDVAHNPHATQLLAQRLGSENRAGKIIAVFSMLKDKDIVGSIKPLSGIIDHWYVSAIEDERAASLTDLAEALDQNQVMNKFLCSTLIEAYQQAVAAATNQDIILVFGSFHTVATMKQYLQKRS